MFLLALGGASSASGVLSQQGHVLESHSVRDCRREDLNMFCSHTAKSSEVAKFCQCSIGGSDSSQAQPDARWRRGVYVAGKLHLRSRATQFAPDRSFNDSVQCSAADTALVVLPFPSRRRSSFPLTIPLHFAIWRPLSFPIWPARQGGGSGLLPWFTAIRDVTPPSWRCDWPATSDQKPDVMHLLACKTDNTRAVWELSNSNSTKVNPT